MYQGQKILLVDDDPNIIEVYTAVFTANKMNFETAVSGNQALEILQKQVPDLILLDIMLPDISGLDILAKLRNDPKTQATQVWMLTNLGDVETQTKAKELGCNEFLMKALFTPKQVLEKINSFFV